MLSLETERLILRDFLMEDWDALNAILSDPEVTRFMHFASWDEVERRAWFEWLLQNASSQEHDAYIWAVTLRNNGTLIGWFGIETASDPVEAAKGARSCGYMLDRSRWGQGYMPEAMQAVFTYEWMTLGTARIIATCKTQNTASARVMQKCGMIYERTCDDDDSEGNRASRHHYAISKQGMDALGS
jgi:[ribosomal protein S5]-alanine N-acetyltransferase